MFNLESSAQPGRIIKKMGFIKDILLIATFFLINILLFVSSAPAQEQNANMKNKPVQNALPKTNKEIILKLFEEVLNRRNLAYFDQWFDPNVIDHNAWEGQPPGAAGIKEAVKGFFDEFSYLKVTVEDIIAEGNKVVTRETWNATLKSTGNALNGSVIHIFLLQNGKVSEEWSKGWEWLGKH